MHSQWLHFFCWERNKSIIFKIDLNHFTDAAPDITQFNNTRRGADRVTRYVNVSQTDAGDTGNELHVYTLHACTMRKY